MQVRLSSLICGLSLLQLASLLATQHELVSTKRDLVDVLHVWQACFETANST